MRIIATLFSLIFMLSGLALARPTKISNMFNLPTSTHTTDTDLQINLKRDSNANYYVLEIYPESASPQHHQIEPATNSMFGPGQPVFNARHRESDTDTVKTVTVNTASKTNSLIYHLIRRIFNGNYQNRQPLTQAPTLLLRQLDTN